MIKIVYIARLRETTLLCSTSEEGELRSIRQTVVRALSKFAQNDYSSLIDLDEKKDLGMFVTIKNGVSYVAIAEKRKSAHQALVFEFLERLASEFIEQYSIKEIEETTRPYAFANFETTALDLADRYNDRIAEVRDSISQINDNLSTTTTILKQNIQDLLERDEKLSSLTTRSSQLAGKSQAFRKKSEQLKWEHFKKAYLPIIIIILVILLVFLVRMAFR